MLYTDDMDEKETKDKDEVPSLQLKIYERIPIPDLPVNNSDTTTFVDSVSCITFFSFYLRSLFSLMFQELTIKFYIVFKYFVGYISS